MPDRKTEILTRTLELVQTIGFNALSYQHLSDRLGISKASIHHHFSKKEDLCQAVLSMMKAGLEGFSEAVLSSEGSAVRKLDQFFAHSIENCDKAIICPVTSLLSYRDKLSRENLSVLKEITDLEVDTMAEIIRQGQQEAVFKVSGDPHALASMVLSASKGAMAYSRVKGSGFGRQVHSRLKAMLIG